MLGTLYSNIMLSSFCLFTFWGLHMRFGTIATKLKGSIYEKSHRLMGVFILMMALSAAIYSFTDIINTDQYYSISLNITIINFASMLFSAIFLPLLGYDIDTKSPIAKIGIFQILIAPVSMWSAIALGDKVIIEYTNIIIAVAVTACVVFHLGFIFKKYNEATKNATCNQYAVGNRFEWIQKSVYYTITLWIANSLITIWDNIHPCVLIIYMIYIVGVTAYIYESFFSFMLNYSEPGSESYKDKDLEDIKLPIQKSINIETKLQIEKELKKWIKAKKYCKKGVTIQSMAAEIYTNRTYLSAYINSTYDCQFKIWVTRLKVGEAKRILDSDKKVSMGEVADMTGFSSATAFAHAFKMIENMPPLKWRETKNEK